ncbi:Clp protease N-terminal domain-containing protein [Nonomuraea monospora]|uniref:Clp protease N-terminal domain-containing protein n=1 Tax=Nonomuraea monospora TaxID=568818 RepID=UPI0031D38CB8
MFEKFTDRARRVVVLSQEEARTLGHPQIGAEHLLLGLIREGEAVAAQVLAGFGVGLDGARRQVLELVGTGEQAPSGHLPFSQGAQQAMQRANRESLERGLDYIGTEHLLLALVRDNAGTAVQAGSAAVQTGGAAAQAGGAAAQAGAAGTAIHAGALGAGVAPGAPGAGVQAGAAGAAPEAAGFAVQALVRLGAEPQKVAQAVDDLIARYQAARNQ